MTTTHTFNVHFWLKKSSVWKDGRTSIYARIWIDSISVDISTKEAVHEKYWSDKARRVRIRANNAKEINDALDEMNSGIKERTSNSSNKESQSLSWL